MSWSPACWPLLRPCSLPRPRALLPAPSVQCSTPRQVLPAPRGLAGGYLQPAVGRCAPLSGPPGAAPGGRRGGRGCRAASAWAAPPLAAAAAAPPPLPHPPAPSPLLQVPQVSPWQHHRHAPEGPHRPGLLGQRQEGHGVGAARRGGGRLRGECLAAGAQAPAHARQRAPAVRSQPARPDRHRHGEGRRRLACCVCCR